MSSMDSSAVDTALSPIVDKEVSSSSHLLPSWVSSFRQQIDLSRERYSKAEVVLDRVATQLSVINTTIEQGKYPKTVIPDTSSSTSSSSSSSTSSSSPSSSSSFVELFLCLPCDVLYMILQQLDLLSICQLEKSTKGMYRAIPNNVYFMVLYKGMVRRKQVQLKENETNYDVHHKVMQSFSKHCQCMSFVKKMRNPQDNRNHKTNNNSIKKHTSPFVILDMLTVLTGNVEDPTIEMLVNEGLVSVLFQFLAPSSETGSVKAQACQVLGNLVCWQIRMFPATFKAFKRQVESVNGVKLLFSLLTSPSASVNLAKHTSRVESGGTVVLRTTSNVTGISTKEAARALTNLFCPSHALSFDNSGIMLSDRFLSIDRPSLWQFRYYHKSGTLKDKSLAHLWLTADGFVFGRGVDGVGCFVLSGRAEAEVNGFSWLFSKSYINQSMDSVDVWLTEINEETGQSDVINNRNRSHIIHTGFFTENDAWVLPDDVYFYVDEESVDDYLEGHDSRTSGFFGVWERSSQGSHFELEKGGVFRANCIHC